MVASVFVRVERRGEEFGLAGPLPLAAIAAYLHVVTAFVNAEQAARCRAALAVSPGHLYRKLQCVTGLERRAPRRHRSRLAWTGRYVPI